MRSGLPVGGERPRGPRLPAAWRGRLEERIRRAWRSRPGPALRLGACAFTLAADVRRLLYDTGVLSRAGANLPIVSVGGLTVGGSAKTPLTAELARWLVEEGETVAVLTHGFGDELEVHRRLTPEVLVLGDPDRRRVAEAAREAGATVALLDDGFQHLRLARTLDVVAVDLDALARTNRARLPAGPFRERFAAVDRAGAVVLTRRSGRGSGAEECRVWLERRLAVPVASCALHPGKLVPANAEAGSRAVPDPAVALTGVMKANLFFEQLDVMCPAVGARYALSDHAVPADGEVRALASAAGRRGIVTTLKDAVKLEGRIPKRVPLWFVSERLVWESGAKRLRRRLTGSVARERGRRRQDGQSSRW